MRIAYVTNSLGMGGIETNLCRLVTALSSRGHAVIVCARHGTLTPTIVNNGGQVVDLEMRPISPISLYRDVCRLRRTLGQGIDLVHVLSAKVALVLWLAIRTLPRSRRPVSNRGKPHGHPILTGQTAVEDAPSSSCHSGKIPPRNNHVTGH